MLSFVKAGVAKTWGNFDRILLIAVTAPNVFGQNPRGFEWFIITIICVDEEIQTISFGHFFMSRLWETGIISYWAKLFLCV